MTRYKVLESVAFFWAKAWTVVATALEFWGLGLLVEGPLDVDVSCDELELVLLAVSEEDSEEVAVSPLLLAESPVDEVAG